MNNTTTKEFRDLLNAFSALIAHTENFYSHSEAQESPDIQMAKEQEEASAKFLKTFGKN